MAFRWEMPRISMQTKIKAQRNGPIYGTPPKYLNVTSIILKI
jgi:hypothetical protein